MPTIAGTQDSPEELVRALLGLERDVVAGCEAAAERVESAKAEAMVAELRRRHLDRLEVLQGLAGDLGTGQPTPLTDKLTAARVAISDVVGGDEAVLRALAASQDDVATAWARASENEALPEALREAATEAVRLATASKAGLEATA